VLGSGYLAKYSRVADLVSLLKDVKPGDTVRVTVSTRQKNQSPVPEDNLVQGVQTTLPSAVTQEFIVRGILNSKVQFVASRAYILDSELKKMIGKIKRRGQSWDI
jgi:hypothetical protein